MLLFSFFQPSPLDPEMQVGTPIKYEMRGYNTLLGSHYDHYYLIYDWFTPEVPSDDVFLLPKSKTLARLSTFSLISLGWVSYASNMCYKVTFPLIIKQVPLFLL